MGYNTFFWGSITIDPPLNEHERAHLNEFVQYGLSATVTTSDSALAAATPGLTADNKLPTSACQWIPTESGDALEYDQEEKFYFGADWMVYLIDTFLKPGASLQHDLARRPSGYEFANAVEHFTFDHSCNGVIDAQGEDADDRWRLIVRDNVVSVQAGDVTFPRETVLVSGRRTHTSGDPALATAPGGHEPVLRLIAVLPDGTVAAWSDPAPERHPDGKLPSSELPATLAEILDSDDLVVPQATPIVRFDLAPSLSAHLLLESGIDPSAALPYKTVLQDGHRSRRYTGDDRHQFWSLEWVSIDLFIEFATQVGVLVQLTS
ncbi:hypothetical protein [Amycolatopsis sp. WAC 01375]|uniref:hypothetical protein n=1 Tax=Amycolatopsis sp. WAC 01375 TaxID=2203194 RepID=UPI0018F61D32|nr:hypothetical protein [Amycolatopsis sp. WAC 01375]